MPEFQYRRLPAASRKISEIKPESDIRVKLVGQVIDKQDGIIVIDDGSGKANIAVEQEAYDKADIGDTVRVFARVIPLEDNYELRGEIFQSMEDVDMGLYKKIMEN